MKEKLITGAELARQLNVSNAFISQQKKSGKLKGCMRDKKYYFIKTCKTLGRNPDNPTYSINHNSKSQKEDTPAKQKTPIVSDAEKKIIDSSISNATEEEASTLLKKIIEVVNDEATTEDKALLDGLKLKASILKEYFLAKNEELKNIQLEESLFSREEVIQVLGAAMSMIRNAMINMPNNYAVNLENADKATIKEYVTDDINKILSDLQAVGKQFEK
jgi:hypothetical protein